MPQTRAPETDAIELDLERVILHQLQWDEGRSKVWGMLEPTDFQCEAHGRIYSAWRGIAQAGEPLDLNHLTVALKDQLEECGGRIGVMDALQPLSLEAHLKHGVYSLALALKRLGAERATKRLALRLADHPEKLLKLLPELRALEDRERPAESWSGAAYSEAVFAQREYPKPVNLLGDGLLSKGDLGILYGKPKLGKSWLALMLARAVASGNPWLGIAGPVEPVRVVFVSLEIKALRLQARLAMLRGEGPASEHLFLLARPDLKGPVDFLDDACYRQIRDFVAALEPALTIWDATSRTHTADENDGQRMAELLARCDRLGQESQSAILLIHHERKSDPKANGKEDDLDALRGSSRFLSDPTLLMRLKRKGGLLQLVCAGANNGPEFDPVWLASGKHGPPTQVESPEKKASDNRERVRTVMLDDGGWLSAAEIGARTNLSDESARRHVAALGAERSTDSSRGRRYRLLHTPQGNGVDAVEKDNALPFNE